MKTVLAFDIGQCCLQLDRPACLQRLGLPANHELPPEMLPAFTAFEHGRLSQPEFLESLRRLCGRSWGDSELLEAFRLMLGTAMPGMAELMAELRNRSAEIRFFSDISIFHWQVFSRQFPQLAGAAPDGVFSFQVGAYKPHPSMYASFEQRFGVPVLYIDDKEENIAGARQRGWPAWRFTSTAAFAAELQRLKLL